jgi:tetratricopeptide (TPR) repeat protein
MFTSFYSYQSGAGRTHVLANIAAYLCFQKGYRVLLVDADFDAPCCHYFFLDSKIPQTTIQRDGLLELAQIYTNTQGNTLPALYKHKHIFNLVKAYNNKGQIDLLPAGNYSKGTLFYKEANIFDWKAWERLGGKVFYETLKKETLRKDDFAYDIVLIDDAKGLFAEVADTHVLVLKPEQAFFEGTKQMIQKIRLASREPRILPVLTRIDTTEPTQQTWITQFTHDFADILPDLMRYEPSTDLAKLFKEQYFVKTKLTPAQISTQGLLFENTNQPLQDIDAKIYNFISIAKFIINLQEQGYIDFEGEHKPKQTKSTSTYKLKVLEGEITQSLRENNYEAVIIKAKEFIAIDASLALPYFALGTAYFYTEQYQKAIQSFETGFGRRGFPVDSESIYACLVGKSYKQIQQPEKAEEWLAKAIVLEPNYQEAWKELAWVQFEAKKYAVALSSFEQVLRTDKQDFEAIAALGKIYFELANFEKALTYFEQYMVHKEADFVGWHWLGKVHERLQNYDKALAYAQKAVALESKIEAIWTNLGNIYQALENYPYALDAYQQATRLNPEATQAWELLGDLQASLGKIEEAVASYQQAGKESKLLTIYEKQEHIVGLADLHFNQRNYQEALPYLQKITQENPENALYWGRLGACYIQQGQHFVGIKALREALRIAYNQPEVWSEMAYAYYHLKDESQALDCLEQALALNNDLPTAWYYKGLIYTQQKNYEKAVEALSKANALQPNYHEAWEALSQVWYLKGNSFIEKEDYHNAVEAFTKATTLKPVFYEAWLALGNIQNILERAEEAILAYQKAIDLKPTFEAYFQAGKIAQKAGKKNYALRVFQEALKISPTETQRLEILEKLAYIFYTTDLSAPAREACWEYLDIKQDNAYMWRILGKAYYQTQRFKKAKKAFERAETLAPHEEAIKSELANVWYMLGNIEKAVAFGASALQLEETFEGWYNLGFYQYHQKDFAEAIQSLQKAVKIKPESKEAWTTLGKALYAEKYYEKAIIAFQKALKILPTTHEAWHGIGLAQASLQQNTKALEAFKKAIECKPDFRQGLHDLGRFYYQIGNYRMAFETYIKAVKDDYTSPNVLAIWQDAEKTCLKMLEKEPQDDHVWQVLGLAYQAMNEKTKAEEALQKSITLNPHNWSAWFTLSVILIEKGDHIKASIFAQKAKELRPESASTWANMASLYMGLKEYPQAIEALEKQISLEKNDEYHIWLTMLASYLKMNNIGKADEYAQKIMTIFPRDESTWYTMGRMYYDAKEYTKALDIFEKIRHKIPAIYWAWHSVGYTLEALQRREEGIAFYEKALALCPFYFEAWSSLGAAYLHIKDLEKGENALLKAQALKPDNEVCIFNMACLRSLQQNKTEMLAILQQLFAKNPKWKETAQKDTDFESFWEDIDFKALIEK